MKININEIENVNDARELFKILIETLAYLRSDEGCVWDREQNHDSIKKNMIEEAYEAVDAIEDKDYQSLKGELGDLLLQIIFHSQIAVENDEFDISDVLKEIIKKLYRRHPHVFGDKNFNTSEEVLISWEEIKKTERKSHPKKTQSIFNDIPKILPSLHYAYEIQNRASRLGFDWDKIGGIFDKIKEEINELTDELEKTNNPVIQEENNHDSRFEYMSKVKNEIGDILFSIVNLTRHLGVDCEECLKHTCSKFIRRFDEIEKLAFLRGFNFRELSIEEKNKLWEEVKEMEE
ncbi:MAG: nucleoside triphosphate pyrophosphohydrolase [Actinomycetota bacterium]|nr:nucleoside triphosphate pyrophosphohydrolase [Actinomycetota bacterium]